jgi:hypothetical protein
MANIFSTPKELKTWAIKLANACGGQKVEKSQILTRLNPNRIDELLAQFERDHTEQIVAAQNKAKEEEE